MNNDTFKASTAVNPGLRDFMHIVKKPAMCPECQTVYPCRERLYECDFCKYKKGGN